MDIRSADNVEFPDADAEGRHVGRFAGDAQTFAWNDASLPDYATNRLYMASDAVRDTDGDGIPDALWDAAGMIHGKECEMERTVKSYRDLVAW